MTRHALVALAALALCGCGGPDETEVPVGTSTLAVEAGGEREPPVIPGPQRLSTEELFKDTAPVVTSPADKTFADQYHYGVDIHRGNGCR